MSVESDSSSDDDVYLICSCCNEVFPDEAGLNQHLFKQHPTAAPENLCKMCGLGFKLQQNLIRHEETFHGNSSSTPTNTTSKKEKRDRKVHDCEVCGAELSSAHNLKQHMVTHTGEKAFSCRFCDSRFSIEANCKRHEIRQHVQKGSKSSSNEENRELFSCEVCLKQFQTRPSRNRHYLQHTGDRPFKCRYCELTFKESSNCRRHELRQHEFRQITADGTEIDSTGNDAEMEESADKTTKKTTLVEGMRFGCGFCDKTFKLPLSCMRHETKDHGVSSVFE